MTVFSEVIITIWTFFVVYRVTKFLPGLKLVGKSLLATLIMLAVIYFVIDWHVVLVLLIAGIVYFGVLYLLGGMKKVTVTTEI